MREKVEQGEALELAPAKLTRHLRVGSRREDGLHEIEAEMVAVDLFDVLVFSPGKGLVLEGPYAQALQGAPNIVDRALDLVGACARVTLFKRVPPGGGLGGGSSDAAAVLRWAGQGRPEAAIRLGSDVPFCVRGGRARVRGAGEIVEPLPYQPLVFTLVLLPFSVSTAAVYRAFDEVGPSPGSNALEKAAFVVEPRIEMVARFLSSIVGVPPTLAGSGSTLFFDGPVEALGLPDSFKVEGIRVSVVEVHSIPAFPLD